jgi:RNA polymerase sigma factor (sigma-70 family)
VRDSSSSASIVSGGSSDDQALERLYVAIEAPLTNVLYRVLWDREEVRDVIQETFVKLWCKRDHVDWERASSLAYKMALDLASSRRRTRRVWRWVKLDAILARGDQRKSAHEQLEDAHEDARVRRAIDALPEGHRRVLMMCTFSELDYAAIASVLDIAAGTVASRRHDAIARIQQSLGEEVRP